MIGRGLAIPLLVAGLLIYLSILLPFSRYMARKPIEEKLGYVPSIRFLKPLSADHKELAGASLVMKVLMYFGGAVGSIQNGKVISEQPDMQGMSRLLHGAVQLDPYNMDAYYFAQGFLTWDAKQYKVANDLLDYGMKYRTWDWMLPFFAGFNSAYFLKDYAKAAEYYKRAGELSGQDLHKSLAGRYLQESGQTDLAITYLSAMEKSERNEVMKKNYGTRLKAYREVKALEVARDRYKMEYGALPTTVNQLIVSGYLPNSPVDPYGGVFYFETGGKVATTSKFAFDTKKQERVKHAND